MWDCKKCQEQLEDSFDVCWKCGTSKDGIEDPAFRPEDDEQGGTGQEAKVEGRIQAAGTKGSASEKRKLGRLPIVTTGNEVSERSITAYLGIVRGIVVRSPSIAQGFLGGLKKIVGGNIESYAEVCEGARREAFERMVAHAAAMGADAVIGMRYDATEFSSEVTEVLAYGTAVKLARK
jgi:uncharacterized protein YbjQ (UPF0145 family)